MKPNFIIIGAQKAGTTWLYRNLQEHPEIFIPNGFELSFFNRKDHNDPKSVEKYLSNFSGLEGNYKRVGEKTPSYFWTNTVDETGYALPNGHNPNIPRDVHEFVDPDAKIIVSLRHPIKRAISAFRHHRSRGRIEGGQSLRDMAARFGIIDIGFYSIHMKNWLEFFEKKNIKPIVFEQDVILDPSAGYSDLCKFLEVDSTYKAEYLRSPVNVGAKPSTNQGFWSEGFGPTDLEFLLDVYSDELQNIRSMLPQETAIWDEITDELAEIAKTGKSKTSGNKNASSRESTQQVEELIFDKARLKSNKTALVDFGVDYHPDLGIRIPSSSRFEPPCRMSRLVFHGACSLGAFSYGVSGHAYTTDIGRYCSIAESVNIGQADHPLDWMSTSPSLFEQRFIIKSGYSFPFKGVYESHRPSIDRSKAATAAVRARTTIGHDVWIGHGAIIIAGVSIGNGAVIGAGAVVTKDVAPYTVVGGVPAKKIRNRFSKVVADRLEALKWWEFAPWQLDDVKIENISDAIKGIAEKRERNDPLYSPVKIKVL